LAVVNEATSPCAEASIGVPDGIARSPTAGACGRRRTSRVAIPWIFAPFGCATSVYLPALDKLKRAT